MPNRTAPTNTDDVIDSRDVIERIAELESDLDGQDLAELEECDGGHESDESQERYDAIEAFAELKPLKALAQEGEDYAPDWPHGAGLIRGTYFVEYARQFADDIGAIGETAWPACHIDWDAAATSLKADYTAINFDGVEYWVR